MSYKSLTTFKILGSVMMAAMMQHTLAASTIHAPAEIIVQNINDKVIKSSFLKSKKQYQVEPGELKIQIRYQDYFENNLNQHDILKSDLIELKVPQLPDQKNYSLKLINPPQDYEQAKQFTAEPKIGLYDEKGQLVGQQTLTIIAQNSSILDRVLNTSTRDSQVETKVQVNATQAEHSALNESANITSAVSQKSQQSGTTYSNRAQLQLSHDEQLKQIWQQSNKSERQKFMSWLAEQ